MIISSWRRNPAVIRDWEGRPRPARLVFLLQDLKFGGTQRQALELARRLDPARFQPEIWLLAGGDDLVPLARDWGIPVTWLARQKRVGPAALARLWLPPAGSPLSTCSCPLPWCPISGAGSGPTGPGAGYCGQLPGRRGSPGSARALALASGGPYHLQQRAIKRVLNRDCGVPEARITVIPNGVDTDYFRPAPEGGAALSAVVLSVARMVPDKDHETLIRAFALVAPAFPRAQLWLVGEGPLLPAVRQLAEEILPPGSYRFIPPQADLRPLFRQAGLLALSSRTEALPNVVLEAMAVGLPVAATAVGGVPELVTPARTGWLAAPGDPPALARPWAGCWQTPSSAGPYGRAGRQRAVQDFSLSAMVSRHEKVFHDLLSTAVRPKDPRDERAYIPLWFPGTYPDLYFG